ncbi:MAG: acyl-CoA thioesterase [Bacteriovoracaceae bacterium]
MTSNSQEPRSPRESLVEMREMVMPNHTNPQNTIFGGVVMSWIDIAAAMCASRHCARPVVTVHIDSITFKEPIKIGHHVHIVARVTYVGKTSMEIEVIVKSENPYTGDSRVTTTAFLTFVAVNEFGKSVLVTPMKIETMDEKKRYNDGKKRALLRKKHLKNSKSKKKTK